VYHHCIHVSHQRVLRRSRKVNEKGENEKSDTLSPCCLKEMLPRREKGSKRGINFLGWGEWPMKFSLRDQKKLSWFA